MWGRSRKEHAPELWVALVFGSLVIFHLEYWLALLSEFLSPLMQTHLYLLHLLVVDVVGEHYLFARLKTRLSKDAIDDYTDFIAGFTVEDKVEYFLDGWMQKWAFVSHMALAEEHQFHILNITLFCLLKKEQFFHVWPQGLEFAIPSPHILASHASEVVGGDEELEEDENVFLNLKHLLIIEVVCFGYSGSEQDLGL